MQIKYKNIVLRDYLASDIEDDVRWNTVETAWALWDAPWEMEEELAAYNEVEHREKLQRYLKKSREGHRWAFEADTADGVHIGCVNAYCIDDEFNWCETVPKEDWKSVRWAVGIDIYESAFWSGGWGTQMLTAFLKYCIKDGYSDLYTQTWSGNERMIALARKLGFRECCRKKELRVVRGEIYDGLTFRLDLAAFCEHCAKLESIDDDLYLHIPTVEDMWFAEALQSDPDTMAYNAGWDVEYDGYHPDTGCIDLPSTEWLDRWTYWVGNEPNRFYAFVREKKTGNFVCEVNFHYTTDKNWWDMGVLVHSSYRGKGYGLKSLVLLTHYAFAVCGIDCLHNDFEETRFAALKIHKKVGFSDVGESRILRFGQPVRVIDLMLTKEQYFTAHPEYQKTCDCGS